MPRSGPASRRFSNRDLNASAHASPIACGKQGSLGVPACQSTVGHHSYNPWVLVKLTRGALRVMLPTWSPQRRRTCALERLS